MARRENTPVKVKIIVTRFVETEETQFKAVVQSLTGKNSNVAAPPRVCQPTAVKSSGRRPAGAGGQQSVPTAAPSLEDLDWVLRGLPSPAELSKLWVD
ncbi:unnamed protein product [Spirodela intermedia]|uniref:VQ domain-containing protein n=1 Tax=Spirodela intermedia TaxID=51605 RepID=A0A7I8LJU7_SPIIN|nr:unnamed protein product [Spirodela intermedia]